MTAREIDRQVSHRLKEMYERHFHAGGKKITSYYSSGRGHYPPELAGEEKDEFGICLVSTDGQVYAMVNSGALATTDLVVGGAYTQAWEKIRDILRTYAANEELEADEEIFREKMRDTDRNRASAYLMRSQGMIGQEVENTLALYLRQCAVSVNCRDLATMAATLANGGTNPITGKEALTRPYVRDVISVMYTCGMHDFAGQWAYEVGILAKSGVSGGILAVIPGKLGIGVFSPGLDAQGNSVRGIAVCEELSERLGLHVFANESEDALLQA